MTRQTQAPAGFPRSRPQSRYPDATVRSGKPEEEAAQTGTWAADPWPPPAVPREPVAPVRTRAAATRARRERGMIGAVPYLAVLVCTAAGVYIAWREGSAGGGLGGVVVGSALLAAAVIRLALPARLAGMLASRHRVTDVLTLTVFGAGLLVAGLVLPRLGPLSAQGRMAGPPMKGKHE